MKKELRSEKATIVKKEVEREREIQERERSRERQQGHGDPAAWVRPRLPR